jgi:hypothetical protein
MAIGSNGMTAGNRPWESKSRSDLTSADLAAWDREIEADFRRVQRGGRKAQRKRQDNRHIGSSWKFFRAAVKATKGNQTALAVAIYVYHRVMVCDSPTVTLATKDLADLGITRPNLFKALRRLREYGLVRLSTPQKGCKTEVTILGRFTVRVL